MGAEKPDCRAEVKLRLSTVVVKIGEEGVKSAEGIGKYLTLGRGRTIQPGRG